MLAGRMDGWIDSALKRARTHVMAVGRGGGGGAWGLTMSWLQILKMSCQILN